MALIGLFGVFVVATVVTSWLTLRAVMTQIQASQADVETDAPGLLYQRAYSIFKTVLAASLIYEFWPGLATWAYDAWHWFGL
jgi:hypothetical protein